MVSLPYSHSCKKSWQCPIGYICIQSLCCTNPKLSSKEPEITLSVESPSKIHLVDCSAQNFYSSFPHNEGLCPESSVQLLIYHHCDGKRSCSSGFNCIRGICCPQSFSATKRRKLTAPSGSSSTVAISQQRLIDSFLGILDFECFNGWKPYSSCQLTIDCPMGFGCTEGFCCFSQALNHELHRPGAEESVVTSLTGATFAALSTTPTGIVDLCYK